MDRKLYQMSSEELMELKEAIKPKRVIIPGDIEYGTPSERVINQWKRLSDKYGFIWHTAEPVDDNDPTDGYFKDGYFYAIPVE